MNDSWNKDELSLEKLKIHARLEAIEKVNESLLEKIVEDKEDTKVFRDELKRYMDKQQTIIFGDGESKKGLANRVSELEAIRGIHSKVIWGIALPSLGLCAKNLWDFFTGKPQ